MPHSLSTVRARLTRLEAGVKMVRQARCARCEGKRILVFFEEVPTDAPSECGGCGGEIRRVVVHHELD
jgi:hypothetical protein